MEVSQPTQTVAAGRHTPQSPRLPVDEDAELLLVKHGSTLPCRIVEIGLAGCRLCTEERFVGGVLVRVEAVFSISGLAFRLSGVTDWTDGKHLVEIRFTDPVPQRLEELAEALRELADRSREPVRKIANPSGTKSAEIAKTEIAAAEPPGQVLPAKGAREMDAAAIPDSGSPSSPIANGISNERRGDPRLDLDRAAEVLLINVGARLPGRILNLGLGGCRIRTDARFPVGIYTRVEVEFQIEGLAFRLGGVVQAIFDRYAVGIRFLDMSDRKRDQVAQFIAEIALRERSGRPAAQEEQACSN